MRDVAEMRREPAERHRLFMRFPRQLIVREPLEQPARGPHLMVVIGEQCVLDCHPDSVKHGRRLLRSSAGALRRQRLLAALCGICVSCAVAACRRSPAAPITAIVDGTLPVDGVTAPGRIVRDRSGVPHIYAQNQDDLFFAQGFVQAQDRLFQMDLWRRSAQGRLSEVLGPNFVERDAMTRRMQYRGGLDEEWGSYGPETKAIATSFTRGINARLEQSLEQLPEEFMLAGWKPERWQPEDLLNRTD